MNRERSERRKNMRKISVLGIKNHRSAAVRGGARRVRPPPLDPLVTNDNRHTHDDTVTKSRLYTCQNDICVTV